MIFLLCNAFAINAGKKFYKKINFNDITKRGFFNIISSYAGEMCVKEIPFLISLHRCFYQDVRLTKGYKIVLRKKTILSLKDKAKTLKNMKELKKSLIYKIDSLAIFKKKKNRYKTMS